MKIYDRTIISSLYEPLALIECSKNEPPIELRGRDKEFQTLKRHIVYTIFDGKTRLIIILGDAGQGKSALISHIYNGIANRRTDLEFHDELTNQRISLVDDNIFTSYVEVAASKDNPFAYIFNNYILEDNRTRIKKLLKQATLNLTKEMVDLEPFVKKLLLKDDINSFFTSLKKLIENEDIKKSSNFLPILKEQLINDIKIEHIYTERIITSIEKIALGDDPTPVLYAKDDNEAVDLLKDLQLLARKVYNEKTVFIIFFDKIESFITDPSACMSLANIMLHIQQKIPNICCLFAVSPPDYDRFLKYLPSSIKEMIEGRIRDKIALDPVTEDTFLEIVEDQMEIFWKREGERVGGFKQPPYIIYPYTTEACRYAYSRARNIREALKSLGNIIGEMREKNKIVLVDLYEAFRRLHGKGLELDREEQKIIVNDFWEKYKDRAERSHRVEDALHKAFKVLRQIDKDIDEPPPPRRIVIIKGKRVELDVVIPFFERVGKRKAVYIEIKIWEREKVEYIPRKQTKEIIEKGKMILETGHADMVWYLITVPFHPEYIKLLKETKLLKERCYLPTLKDEEFAYLVELEEFKDLFGREITPEDAKFLLEKIGLDDVKPQLEMLDKITKTLEERVLQLFEEQEAWKSTELAEILNESQNKIRNTLSRIGAIYHKGGKFYQRWTFSYEISS